MDLSTASSGNFDGYPNEMLRLVLQYSIKKPQDLVYLSLVCRLWRAVCSSFRLGELKFENYSYCPEYSHFYTLQYFCQPHQITHQPKKQNTDTLSPPPYLEVEPFPSEPFIYKILDPNTPKCYMLHEGGYDSCVSFTQKKQKIQSFRTITILGPFCLEQSVLLDTAILDKELGAVNRVFSFKDRTLHFLTEQGNLSVKNLETRKYQSVPFSSKLFDILKNRIIDPIIEWIVLQENLKTKENFFSVLARTEKDVYKCNFTYQYNGGELFNPILDECFPLKNIERWEHLKDLFPFKFYHKDNKRLLVQYNQRVYKIDLPFEKVKDVLPLGVNNFLIKVQINEYKIYRYIPDLDTFEPASLLEFEKSSEDNCQPEKKARLDLNEPSIEDIITNEDGTIIALRVTLDLDDDAKTFIKILQNGFVTQTIEYLLRYKEVRYAFPWIVFYSGIEGFDLFEWDGEVNQFKLKHERFFNIATAWDNSKQTFLVNDAQEFDVFTDWTFNSQYLVFIGDETWHRDGDNTRLDYLHVVDLLTGKMPIYNYSPFFESFILWKHRLILIKINEFFILDITTKRVQKYSNDKLKEMMKDPWDHVVVKEVKICKNIFGEYLKITVATHNLMKRSWITEILELKPPEYIQSENEMEFS